MEEPTLQSNVIANSRATLRVSIFSEIDSKGSKVSSVKVPRISARSQEGAHNRHIGLSCLCKNQDIRGANQPRLRPMTSGQWKQQPQIPLRLMEPALLRDVIEGTPALEQVGVNCFHFMLSTPCYKQLPFQVILHPSRRSSRIEDCLSDLSRKTRIYQLVPLEARVKTSRSPASD